MKKHSKTVTVITLAVLCMSTLNLKAANELLAVEKDSVWSPNGAFRFVTKDGQAAAPGTIIFKLVFPSEYTYDPPTTNVPAGGLVVGESYDDAYCDPAHNLINYQWGTVRMGVDSAGQGFPSAGEPGFASGFIYSSVATDTAVLRAFSGTNCPASVYYTDTTPAVVLNQDGEWNYTWDTLDIPITNINPAYAIQYITNPHTSTPVQISGRVANIGTGNNQLVSDAVEVRFTGTSTESVDVSGDGSFTYYVPEAGEYTVQAYVPSASPRPGFPISDEFTVNAIPEPAMFGLASLIVLLGARKMS